MKDRRLAAVLKRIEKKLFAALAVAAVVLLLALTGISPPVWPPAPWYPRHRDPRFLHRPDE